MLRDGRVGFIDFGIVGRISPSTWGAIQAFFVSTAERDYDVMATALVQMGAAERDVVRHNASLTPALKSAPPVFKSST